MKQFYATLLPLAAPFMGLYTLAHDATQQQEEAGGSGVPLNSPQE